MRTTVLVEEVINIDGRRVTVWRVAINGRTVLGAAGRPSERTLRRLEDRFRIAHR